METVRLYDQDSHLARWEAVVLDCQPIIDGYHIVLDRTAFFPERSEEHTSELQSLSC